MLPEYFINNVNCLTSVNIYGETFIDNSLNVSGSLMVGQSSVNVAVLYVDDEKVGINTETPNVELTVNGSISSNNTIFDRNGNSEEWNSVYTTYNKNSSNYATQNYVQNNFLALTGGTVTGDTQFNKNVTIWGVLSATGGTYFANTIYSTTSALSVIHVGNGPAVYVGQSGTGDIASFYDLDQNIEMLHIGGHDGDYPNVGIKTSTPNVDFTVNGEISSSEIIYDASGNSNQWNSVYTSVKDTSANWNSVYTTYNKNSATYATIEFANNKFLPLSGGIITGDLTVDNILQIGDGNPIFDFIITEEGNVGINTETPNEKLTVVGNISCTGFLYGDGSNLTGIIAGDTVATTLVRTNSANWDSVYSSVNPVSSNWNSVYSSVNPVSSKWNSVYSTINTLSSNWQTTYNTVSSLSGYWTQFQPNPDYPTDAQANADVEGDIAVKESMPYGTIYNLGGWGGPAGGQALIYNSTNTFVVTNPFQTPLANHWALISDNGDGGYEAIDIAYQEGGAYPWSVVYENGLGVSKAQAARIVGTPLAATASEGTSTFASRADHVHPLPAEANSWNSNYTLVQGKSANWDSVYTTYNTNSAKYSTIEFVDNKFLPLSGGIVDGNLSVLSSFEVGFGSSVLFVSESVVGINTETPNEALTVVGNVSAIGIIYSNNGNSNQWNSAYTNFSNNSSNYIKQNGNSFNTRAIVGTIDNNDFSINTNNTEKMRIFSNGNVAYDDFSNLPGAAGNSTYKVMHYASPTNAGSTMLSMASKFSHTVFFGNLGGSTGGFVIGSEGIDKSISFKQGLTYSDSNTLGTGTTVMSIAGNGNVGINTTTPNEKLTVVGNISATQDYFSGSNKSVFTPQTNTVGVSAISNIVAVSALPVSPDPSTLYIVI